MTPPLHGECIVCGRPVRIGGGKHALDGDGASVPLGDCICWHYRDCREPLEAAIPAAVARLAAELRGARNADRATERGTPRA